MRKMHEETPAAPKARQAVSASGRTSNDFYDFETVDLPGPTAVVVDGEIANPGTIDLTPFPTRSMIVKETVFRNGKPSFVGAYRYDGVALDEVLNLIVVRKRNEKEFPRVIDAYVEIGNDRGDSVVLSWGEIYYPVHRHEILLAARVTRIIPSKSKDLWPLPAETRLVVPSDLVAERNIPVPARITVRSLDDPFKGSSAGTRLFSPDFGFSANGRPVVRVGDVGAPTQAYPTVFYGRGRGIHGVTEFKGVPLRSLLAPHVPVTGASLRRGLVTAEGADGYRSAFTAAEIMNRCDQSEVLVIDDAQNDGGRFRLFASSDYFSDRAVKSLSAVRYVERG